MRKIISKKTRQPTLKELQARLVEAVTNLSESFKDNPDYESTASAEAAVRALERQIKEWHKKNPRGLATK